jgi:pimeloyl-ACP methyl ester carboxylesterase
MAFLEAASETGHPSPTSQRARTLRAAMGVRAPSGWCEVDGCRVAWEETQTADESAQAILCLHAAGTGSREFRPLTHRCPVGSRLIFVDWPGHGRSEEPPLESGGNTPQLTIESCATILQTLLNQLGIDMPILLGSGFGAAVALRFAADHPGQVRGLVLCLPAGLVPTSATEPFSQRGKRGVGRLLRRMKSSVPANTGKDTTIAARRQALRMEALRPAMQSLRAAAKESADRSLASLQKALDSLSCPALFALSHASREYPLRKYLALLDPSLAWTPKHQFTVFAGAFHPLWDEPERFALALTSFVQAQLPVEKHTHAWLIHAVDWPTKDTNLWKCVHPDCAAERALPAGQNANEAAVSTTQRRKR